MKVLVTGSEGFIGSHLVEDLITKGYEVRALYQYNSFNNKGWLEDSKFKQHIEFVSGDVRDPYLFQNILKNVEIVFNLAALIAIPYSYFSPQSYLETNVKGVLNLCNGALKNNTKVIQFSTSEVYGTAEKIPINEKHPLKPQSPYSASKIAADSFAMSYYYSYDLPVSIFRPFNTFGPRQSIRAVIPTIIRQLKKNNKNIIKLGDLRPSRDFNYVKNITKFIYQLSKNKKIYGNSINIGSNSEVTILQLYKIISKLIGSSFEIKTDKNRLRPLKSEVFRLKCDNKLLKSMINYNPEYKFNDGLEETINWFNDSNINKYYSNDNYSL